MPSITHSFESAMKVRPAATVDGNAPGVRSNKGEYIKIGGELEYRYSTDQVMRGSRGDEKRESVRGMNIGGINRKNSFGGAQNMPRRNSGAPANFHGASGS